MVYLHIDVAIHRLRFIDATTIKLPDDRMVDSESNAVAINLFHAGTRYQAELATISIAMGIVFHRNHIGIEHARKVKLLELSSNHIHGTMARFQFSMSSIAIGITMNTRSESLHPQIASKNEV